MNQVSSCAAESRSIDVLGDAAVDDAELSWLTCPDARIDVKRSRRRQRAPGAGGMGTRWLRPRRPSTPPAGGVVRFGPPTRLCHEKRRLDRSAGLPPLSSSHAPRDT